MINSILIFDNSNSTRDLHLGQLRGIRDARSSFLTTENKINTISEEKI